MAIINQAELISQNIDDQQANFQLLIPEQLVYFEGHFLNLPILPGLTQITWAIEYASQISHRYHIKQINRLKFSGLILPNSQLTLSIEYKPQLNRVDFRYHDHLITFSQGQLLYRD